MFKTLYLKLAAVLVGLFCLIGISLIVLYLWATRHYFLEVNQTLNRNLAPHLVAEKLIMHEGHINEAVIEHIFHQLMVVNPGIEVYLLDPDGKILAFSAPPGRVKREAISLGPVKEFLDKTGTFPILGEDPRDPQHKKVFSAAPVPPSGPVEGYLYVILGGEEFDSAAQLFQGSYILRLSMCAGAGVLLFALITSLLLFSRMTRPLRQLTTTMETFRKSDFTESPDFSTQYQAVSKNEIYRLGAIFKQMADRIVQQIQKLRQNDALRREFVANIAHDLRTPLTSLHGYLETLILKRVELNPQEQHEYLAIAIRRSEQLGKLVNELLELAYLDSPDVQVRPESFSLVELVQDVIQKFQLAAEKKKIEIRTDFLEYLPLVFADIGLVERVFDNLIENAIRYTPENGSITITVVPGDEKLLVKVSDSGPGISPEKVPNLFERFYRQKRVRPWNADGTGLGLAITRKILELHQSGIEVESKVNAGTTFAYTLPVYKTQSSRGLPPHPRGTGGYHPNFSRDGHFTSP